MDDNSLTLLLQVASHRFLELHCNYMDTCHNVSAYTPPNIPNILSIPSPHISVHSTDVDMNFSVSHLPPDNVALSHVDIEHALELCTSP